MWVSKRFQVQKRPLSLLAFKFLSRGERKWTGQAKPADDETFFSSFFLSFFFSRKSGFPHLPKMYFLPPFFFFFFSKILLCLPALFAPPFTRKRWKEQLPTPSFITKPIWISTTDFRFSTLRLRSFLGSRIKQALKNFIHRGEKQEITLEHSIILPCTEQAFVGLFPQIPFIFSGDRYTIDMGGEPAWNALCQTLGPHWDKHEEEETGLTAFVGTEMKSESREYFMRLTCKVENLVSIERDRDYSVPFSRVAYDLTHLVFSFHIHSHVFRRPTKQS
jgi:hypothetical protein